MTRSDVGKGHPEYYQDLAARLARETPGAFFVNQFGNPANPRAHEETTGARDLGADGARARRDRVRRRLGRHAHRADALLRARRARGRDRARRSGRLDPRRATRSTGKLRRRRLVAGRGHRRGLHAVDRATSRACTPPTPSPTRRASAPRASCSRARASSPARRPARCSPRRCATAARRSSPKRVVTFVCDSGNKYLSKVYNDYWMLDQGFLEREHARRPARPDRAAARASAPR